jgi:hypothetical protein
MPEDFVKCSTVESAHEADADTKRNTAAINNVTFFIKNLLIIFWIIPVHNYRQFNKNSISYWP